MDERNVHKGHRKRTKESMLEHGIDSLNDHQVLEILLFYGIPNGDTNPIAHRLVEEFGSLRGVLEADYDKLCRIKGISDNSAGLIKFVQQLSRRYLKSACFSDEKSHKFDSTESLREYFESVFLGVETEEVHALVVDDELKLVAEAKISEGTIGKVQISARKIADFVIMNRCDRVVLAHNHPKGVCMPSKADIIKTKELTKLLSELEISVIDHIIVGRNGSFSLRASNHAQGIWTV